jgi:hypothetical protein
MGGTTDQAWAAAGVADEGIADEGTGKGTGFGCEIEAVEGDSIDCTERERFGGPDAGGNFIEIFFFTDDLVLLCARVTSGEIINDRKHDNDTSKF